MTTASWVIVDRLTDHPVLETYLQSVADKVNRARYDVFPILEYLQNLNRAIRAKRA